MIETTSMARVAQMDGRVTINAYQLPRHKSMPAAPLHNPQRNVIPLGSKLFGPTKLTRVCLQSKLRAALIL